MILFGFFLLKFRIFFTVSNLPFPLSPFILESSRFIIKDWCWKRTPNFRANMRDEGVYSCRAKNEAGDNTVDFKLVVLVPPKIIILDSDRNRFFFFWKHANFSDTSDEIAEALWRIRAWRFPARLLEIQVYFILLKNDISYFQNRQSFGWKTANSCIRPTSRRSSNLHTSLETRSKSLASRFNIAFFYRAELISSWPILTQTWSITILLASSEKNYDINGL